jgi:hypothetical protein
VPGHHQACDPAVVGGISDADPVPIGEHDIGEHKVVGAGLKLGQGFSQRGNEVDPVAGRDQDVLHDRPDIRVVLDKEDELRVFRHRPSASHTRTCGLAPRSDVLSVVYHGTPPGVASALAGIGRGHAADAAAWRSAHVTVSPPLLGKPSIVRCRRTHAS